MESLDFAALADKLLSNCYGLVQSWLPAGKLNGREYKVGNVRGDAGDSLSINIDTGVWSDFATGDKGGDLIDLYAKINGIDLGEAAKALGADTSVKKDMFLTGRQCNSIPAHRLGRPIFVAEYKTTAGVTIGYVCRFAPTNERKQDIPLTFWQVSNGEYRWKWKKWPIQSPVYRADQLAVRSDAKILIVEGEKKADRAQQLLPDWVVIGWVGGCKNVKGTDWSVLQGRICWIWPDADQVGLEAAETLQKIVPHLKVVDIVSITPHLTEHWDLGDAPDDYDAEQYMRDGVEMTKASATLPALAESTLPARLDAINSQYAVIMRGSQVLVMRYWMAEDNHSRLIFLAPRDFLLWHENNVVYIETDKGVKPIKVAKSWLEWKDRQEYEEVYFEPGGQVYKKRYNLWRGFSYKPDPNAGQFNLLLEHIQKNICQGNQEQYEWVMAWLADLFQKTGRKLGTALVLRGPMGIGKGAFANHIGKLLGIHYMPITQKGQLTGKFNGHMADKVLMFVDEGWWSDEANGAGTLRALITEPGVTIEMKGKDAVTLPNYTRFIVAANEDWVVPVGMGDERRFVILDVGRVHQRDRAYFQNIDDQLRDGGYEALLHYLLNYKYSPSLPGNVIHTAALLEQKIHSMPPEMKWLYDCLFKESIGEFTLSNRLDNDMSCHKFYDSYLRWCQDMNHRPLTVYALSPKLKKANLFLVRKKKTTDPLNGRTWYYMLPNLSTMRDDFQTALGGQINWEDGAIDN